MRTVQELSEVVERGILELSFPDEPKNLYDPIRYALASGGKRLRPVLTLAACNLFSDAVEQALYPSLAVEVFHNFTLIHDDIMDNALLRRNQPTVFAKWNANTAILSGDVMCVHAYQLLAKSNGRHMDQLLQVFNTIAQCVCEGQQYDMDFETSAFVTEQEYIHMIEMKTAALLQGALQLGAIVAEAPQPEVTNIGEFGRNLGIAFQLQDDLLDAYGDAKRFGKRIGGDIITNKKTFLAVKAFSLAKGNTLNLLDSYFKAPNMDPESKVEGVIKIYNELGIKSLTENEIAKYYGLATQALARIECQPNRKVLIESLAHTVMNRTS